MKTNNMKQAILSSATNLIAKNGVQNTSLADIAKDVNISKGTLYYHYASKNDIIYDIADTHLEVITSAILNCVKNVKSKNSQIEMVNLILEKISTIESRGRVHMYLICEAITSNDDLKERMRLKYIEWRTTLKSEIVESLEKYSRSENEQDAESFSFLLMSIVDGLVVQSLLRIEKIPYENIASFLVNHWI